MQKKKYLPIVQRFLITSLWLTAPILLSLLLFGASCRTNQGSTEQKNSAATDSEYLRNAGAQWDKLFNTRDTSSLASLYAEGAVSMPYNAPTVRGRKAIQAELDKFLSENTGRHETSVEEVLIGDGWAIERARYTMTYTPKGAGTQIIETGRHVMCRKKVDGRWEIAWEIWNTDQPSPK